MKYLNFTKFLLQLNHRIKLLIDKILTFKRYSKVLAIFKKVKNSSRWVIQNPNNRSFSKILIFISRAYLLFLLLFIMPENSSGSKFLITFTVWIRHLIVSFPLLVTKDVSWVKINAPNVILSTNVHFYIKMLSADSKYYLGIKAFAKVSLTFGSFKFAKHELIIALYFLINY